MKFVAPVTLVALVAVCGAQTPNYCDKSLCPANTVHVACNGLTTLSSACGAGATEVALTSSQKDLVVDLHNKLRSTVAQGKQANGKGQLFSQAVKMATVQWDQELANLAAANARSCVFKHDQCRNTATMKYVGQNIATTSYYGMTYTVEQLVDKFVNDWFSESKDTTTAQIASFPSSANPVIGHFTQIVSDRSSKVGCSLVSYNTGQFRTQLFVCNYGVTNIVGQPVYVSGTMCSKCTTGCNPTYPGLCSKSEPFSNSI